ncbi:MAG TPA: Ig-like domain-containing protein [Gemmatimonadaceae bacterium]|nr:Ig-like domain-containing protein [Gemmatimonadaceae bacterium]
MLRPLVNSLSLGKVALLVALAGVGGCTLNTDVSGPTLVLKVSGENQQGPTSTALPTPLAVAVFDQFGERLPNITVTWMITSGGGALSATSTTTDDTGTASVIYTTGPTARIETVQAKVEGIPALTFSITVNP